MGNVADKEMQFSPMDLPNNPEFALENSLFVLRQRAEELAAQPRSAGDGRGIETARPWQIL